MPALLPGGILVRVLYLSLDPYPLKKNQLLLNGDVLPDWFAYLLQFLTSANEKSPSGGYFMGLQQLLFHNEVVKICQAIREESVKLGPVQ